MQTMHEDEQVATEIRPSMVGARAKYPWDRIAPGQSFWVAGRTPSQMSSARRNAEKRLGAEFECRSEERDGRIGTRVRRLA